jgi:hypothetical protein
LFISFVSSKRVRIVSNLGGMTDGQVITAFALAVAAGGSLLADAYTTMIGLQHGLTEGNPLMRLLFKKVGLPFATFLSGSFTLILGAALSSYSVYATDAFFGIVLGVEIPVVLRNYRLLKAAKISLK